MSAFTSLGQLYSTEQVSSKPEVSPEEHFWKSFAQLGETSSHGGIQCIEANPVVPHEFLIATGTKLSVFDTNENQIKSQIAFVQTPIFCAKYRADGKLIVVGSEKPNVLVFANNGDRLRVFIGHTATVRTTGFSSDRTHLFSGSEDRTVRYWDLPANQEVAVFTGHNDKVKTGMFNPASPNIIVTGGYDYQIYVWDVRVGARVCKMNQGVPVESLTILPDGATIVASGTNNFKTWDLVSGGKMIHSQSNHQKTISHVAYDHLHNRLITAGLDQLVKIYNLPSYEVIHSFDFQSPVLSAAISVDGETLGVGQTDRLTIRGKVKSEVPEKEVKVKENLNRGSTRYFLRSFAEPTADTLVVSNKPKKVKYSSWDKALKTFQYGKALDMGLGTANPTTIIPLLKELKQRDGLQIAISGRDETTLAPLLDFLSANMSKHAHIPFLLEIVHMVLDIYGPVIEKGSKLETAFKKIKAAISGEIRFQENFLPLLGSLELIINSSIATMPIETSGAGTPLILDS